VPKGLKVKSDFGIRLATAIERFFQAAAAENTVGKLAGDADRSSAQERSDTFIFI